MDEARKKLLMDSLEHLPKGKPCDLFERVHRRQLSSETQEWLEKRNFREAQDWSYLNSQVVGAEISEEEYRRIHQI